MILRSQLTNSSQFWSKFCRSRDQCKSSEKNVGLYVRGGDEVLRAQDGTFRCSNCNSFRRLPFINRGPVVDPKIPLPVPGSPVLRFLANFSSGQNHPCLQGLEGLSSCSFQGMLDEWGSLFLVIPNGDSSSFGLMEENWSPFPIHPPCPELSRHMRVP